MSLLCLGANTGMTTEKLVQKSVDEAVIERRPFCHSNSLSKPNTPSTISEDGSCKTAAERRRKSDSAVSLTGFLVQPTSVSATTVNGHLPSSLLATKSKTPNCCKVPSGSSERGSSERLKSNDTDCLQKKNKSLVNEACCGSTTPNCHKTKSISADKRHKHSSSESMMTEILRQSRSELNCRVNLNGEGDRARTHSGSGKVHDETTVTGRTSNCLCTGSVEELRIRGMKLSGAKPESFLSTTEWHVTTFSDDNILPGLTDIVHATTAWHVADAASKRCDVSDNASVSCQTNTSAAGIETVRGGHEHMLNGSSVLHDTLEDKRRPSVKQATNCMYHCNMSVTIEILKNMSILNLGDLFLFCSNSIIVIW